MNKFKFFIAINLCILFSACGSVKEGFTNQKKDNSDEFLVEKKSPLVLPPEYGSLPLPDDQQSVINEIEKENLEISISKNKSLLPSTKKSTKETSIEKSILEKIK